MKQFVGYLLRKAAGKKVSPTIKSVKPTKDIKGSVKRVYRDETSKRIDATTKVKEKMAAGKKMMREAQKERKKLVDTGRAFQFKGSKDTFAIRPGENPKEKFKGLIKDRNKASKKVFKTGKQLEAEKRNKASKKAFAAGGTVEGAKKISELVKRLKGDIPSTPLPRPKSKVRRSKPRENKMGGGMTGRRMGMKKGSKFPDLTGDGKVTFADILKGRGVINGKKKKSDGRTFLAKK